MLFLCSLPLFVNASEHGQEPDVYRRQQARLQALCAAFDGPASGYPPACVHGPPATKRGDNLIKTVWTPRPRVSEVILSSRRYYRTYCTMSIE
jgi:hypothetical protein